MLEVKIKICKHQELKSKLPISKKKKKKKSKLPNLKGFILHYSL
jgi:hypothetical protein